MLFQRHILYIFLTKDENYLACIFMYIENKLFLIKRNLYKICGLPLILFPFGSIFSCRNRGGASEYIENLLILKPTCGMQYSYPFGVHVSISSVISLFLMCDPTTNVYIQAPVEF